MPMKVMEINKTKSSSRKCITTSLLPSMNIPCKHLPSKCCWVRASHRYRHNVLVASKYLHGWFDKSLNYSEPNFTALLPHSFRACKYLWTLKITNVRLIQPHSLVVSSTIYPSLHSHGSSHTLQTQVAFSQQLFTRTTWTCMFDGHFVTPTSHLVISHWHSDLVQHEDTDTGTRLS